MSFRLNFDEIHWLAASDEQIEEKTVDCTRCIFHLGSSIHRQTQWINANLTVGGWAGRHGEQRMEEGTERRAEILGLHSVTANETWIKKRQQEKV